MATVAANISNISPVDRLGDIKAEIARLKDIEAFLLDEIKDLGAGAHEGDTFRATVSEIAERTSLCPKAAEAKLREMGVARLRLRRVPGAKFLELRELSNGLHRHITRRRSREREPLQLRQCFETDKTAAGKILRAEGRMEKRE